MSLSFGTTPLLLVLALAVAAGLTAWSYYETTPALQGWRRWVPATLRVVALSTLLVLLFEPVLQSIQEREQPPLLAVLIDDSESLRVMGSSDASEDANSPDARDERNNIGRIDRALQSIRSIDGRVEVFSFDRAVRRLEGDAAVDSLRQQGTRTDITTALESVRNEFPGENLSGVVLFSDGRYNSGRNPLYAAERSPVPIHTVTLGDTTGSRDVQVRQVETNDLAYVGSKMPVVVDLRANQAGGERVTIRLRRNGETLARETVELADGATDVPVQLTYTPESAGVQTLEVSVSSIPGEATLENNVATRSVEVLESKRRILLLAGAPSPDVSATRRILEQSADTEVEVRVARQDGQFYGGSFPSDFENVDVLVLAGFPSASVPASAVDPVASAVGDGLPVLFLLQPSTDLERLGRFTDGLPVSIDRSRSQSVEVMIQPVEGASAHPILQFASLDAPPWERLPPLTYNESLWSVSPDARVLATTRVRGMNLEDPALVIRSRTGQRSAALLAHGTWRWANPPSDLEDARTVWPTMLSNLIRWVGARGDDRRVRVQTTRDVYSGGEQVRFTGQVYDESLEPVTGATVDVRVSDANGTDYPFTMTGEGSGRYTLDAGVLPEGSYQFEATATANGGQIGSTRGRFTVGGVTVEYRETRADASLMRQIASRSGGQAVVADDVEQLSRAIESDSGFEAATQIMESEFELWRLTGFLVLILGCLVGEWALRKRFGLV